MRGPDFVMIGAMKCGTTYLWELLCAHPRTHLPPLKEPAVLLAPTGHRTRYAELFDGIGADSLTGEATTSYVDPLHAERAAMALRAVAARCRLLMLVRDPIERARSHHRHEVVRAREEHPFTRAVADAESSYVRRSRYASGVYPFLNLFGDQLLVLPTTALRDGAWEKVQKHLSLPLVSQPQTRKLPSRDRARRRRWVGLVSRGPVPRWLAQAPTSLRRVGRRVARTADGPSSRGPVPPAIRELLLDEALRFRDLVGWKELPSDWFR